MARPNKYPCFDDYYEAKDYAIDHGICYVIIAQQLCYPPDIIEELSNAKTETEAEIIMAKARHIL